VRDLESLDTAFVIGTFLLLLIGIGPKIAALAVQLALNGLSDVGALHRAGH